MHLYLVSKPTEKTTRFDVYKADIENGRLLTEQEQKAYDLLDHETEEGMMLVNALSKAANARLLKKHGLSAKGVAALDTANAENAIRMGLRY